MQQINHKNKKFLLLFFIFSFSILVKPVYCDDVFAFGINTGVYQIDYKHVSATDSVSGRAIASQPTIGIFLYASTYLPLVPKYVPFSIIGQAGYNYNFPTDNLSVSYSFTNLLLKNQLSIDIEGFFGAGLLYSSWNQEINGGIGWQTLLGAKNSEGLYFGLRYLSVPGTRIAGGYQSTFNLSQTTFDISIYF